MILSIFFTKDYLLLFSRVFVFQLKALLYYIARKVIDRFKDSDEEIHLVRESKTRNKSKVFFYLSLSLKSS